MNAVRALGRLRRAGHCGPCGLRRASGPAAQGRGDAGAQRGRGLRHAVRRELRGLPRAGGTRRRRHRAGRSRLSAHRRRRDDAHASSPMACAGTAMPAFAQSAGGMLTDEQIDVIARGIRSRWSRRTRSRESTRLPTPRSPRAMRATAKPRIRRTARRATARTDRAAGRAAPSPTIRSWRWSAIRGCARSIIAGRPELGAPDWRGNVPGQPMSEQEVTDVVAWLASHRVPSPGQPYSAATHPQR